MDVDRLETVLQRVRGGELSVSDALEALRLLPFEDLGFAKIDHHRALRTGFPEVVYCPGKTPEHVVAILERVTERCSKALATRASPEIVQAVLQRFPDATFHEQARILVAPGAVVASARAETRSAAVGPVMVLSAGTADLPVAEEAAVTAQEMGSPVERLYDVGVAGIHRLLSFHDQLIAASAVVVVAGMDGALPSVVGGLVERPVIAVPTSVGYGASFGGLAPLLTMLNSCATGVAVVNIDNGFGGGYMAHLIREGRA